MIQLFEISLYQKFQEYWTDLVANIGKTGDYIPDIFAGLPATGSGGSNQAAIGQLFTTRATGDAGQRLNILLQYPAIKAHIPCISVEVQEEQEDQTIGSMVSEVSSNGNTSDLVGGAFTKRYSIGVYSWSADETLYLFAFVKYMLLDIRSSMNASTLDFFVRKAEADYTKFENPVFYRYVDITAPGIIDYVTRQYDTVTSVTVNDTEYINNINIAPVDFS